MQEANATVSLVLNMKPALLGEFFLLLQQGFGVTVRTGCTLGELLEGELHLDPAYVAGRITTIFLNGRAIDDVNSALMKPLSTIALSGAMPGLVGATMRRGGFYAAMREGITHREEAALCEEQTATVRVKLFNILLPELGPLFLRRGIVLDSGDARAFFGGRSASFQQGCAFAQLDGRQIPVLSLGKGEPFSGEATVRLIVHFEEQP